MNFSIIINGYTWNLDDKIDKLKEECDRKNCTLVAIDKGQNGYPLNMDYFREDFREIVDWINTVLSIRKPGGVNGLVNSILFVDSDINQCFNALEDTEFCHMYDKKYYTFVEQGVQINIMVTFAESG